MDTMWEKIQKSLKDAASLSIDKIEEYSKVGKLKVEEFASKRKIERTMIDIGERVYDLLTEGKGGDIQSDPTIAKAVESVTSLRGEIDTLNEKMKEVSEEAKKQRDEEKGTEAKDEEQGIGA
jgi:hypothetical protein